MRFKKAATAAVGAALVLGSLAAGTASARPAEASADCEDSVETLELRIRPLHKLLSPGEILVVAAKVVREVDPGEIEATRNTLGRSSASLPAEGVTVAVSLESEGLFLVANGTTNESGKTKLALTLPASATEGELAGTGYAWKETAQEACAEVSNFISDPSFVTVAP